MTDIIDSPIQITPLSQMVPTEIAPQPLSIIGLMRDAVLAKDSAMLAQLEGMWDRASDREAQCRFDDSFARFQSECPMIPATGKSFFKRVSKEGLNIAARFPEKADIQTTCLPLLTRYGLSLSWHEEYDGTIDYAVATVRGFGKSRSTRRKICPDTTRNKPHFDYEAVLSFAERRAALSLFGVPFADADKLELADAEEETGEPISAEQVKELTALIDELATLSGKTDEWERFVAMAQVANVAEITTDRYAGLVDKVQRTLTAQKEGRRK